MAYSQQVNSAGFFVHLGSRQNNDCAVLFFFIKPVGLVGFFLKAQNEKGTVKRTIGDAAGEKAIHNA